MGFEPIVDWLARIRIATVNPTAQDPNRLASRVEGGFGGGRINSHRQSAHDHEAFLSEATSDCLRHFEPIGACLTRDNIGNALLLILKQTEIPMVEKNE